MSQPALTDLGTPFEAIEPRPRHWTRDEYYRAAELGLFRPDERLELIQGEVIEKVSPQRTPHMSAIRAITEAFETAFGLGWEIRSQGPLRISDDSEPEPDVLVVPGTWRDYEDHHPIPTEVRLLVEVSDNTLHYDRSRKAALYATATIAEYWIVNLVDRRLEVHRNPLIDGYQTITLHTPDEQLAPLFLPTASMTVSDLLPSVR